MGRRRIRDWVRDPAVWKPAIGKFVNGETVEGWVSVDELIGKGVRG